MQQLRTFVAVAEERSFTAAAPVPTGPMAWESAVTNHGCVGLTTRMASVSTLPGTVLVDVDPQVTLPVDAVWPRHRGPSAVSDFVDAAAGLRS